MIDTYRIVEAQIDGRTYRWRVDGLADIGRILAGLHAWLPDAQVEVSDPIMKVRCPA